MAQVVGSAAELHRLIAVYPSVLDLTLRGGDLDDGPGAVPAGDDDEEDDIPF